MFLTFPSPQYSLLPDAAGPRFYANVDNRLELSLDGEVRFVAVAVPTGLFTFMFDVCKTPVSEIVKLAIDEVPRTEDESRFVFSLMFGDNLYDLWDYSRMSLPQWMLSSKYWL